MALIQINADFKLLVYELRLLREAIERAVPPKKLQATPGARKLGAEDITIVTDADRMEREAERAAASLKGHRPQIKTL